MTLPVTIREARAAARFSLRVGAADREVVGAAVGVPLPTAIGARSQLAGRDVLCLGPDEWSVVVAEADAASLMDACAALSVPHSLVAVGDRDVAIELVGELAEELLAHGIPIDLSQLAVGAGTRTVLDGVGVVLRRDGPDRFQLEAWRSMMPHVLHLLHEVTVEFAAEAADA